MFLSGTEQNFSISPFALETEYTLTWFWLPAAATAKSLQSCPTLRPRRRQPTRLSCPWDSPGKNTGVGCHFLLQCMKVKSESEIAQLCPTLHDPMDCSPPGSSVYEIFQPRVWSGLPLPFPLVAWPVGKQHFLSHKLQPDPVKRIIHLVPQSGLRSEHPSQLSVMWLHVGRSLAHLWAKAFSLVKVGSLLFLSFVIWLLHENL